MKKRIYLWIAVPAIIGAQFMGCSCEKIPKPDPPVILQPKVEMTVSPTGILPYGATCNVSWTSTNGKSIILNNKSVGPEGSVADKLYRDTVYTIIVTNENLSAKAEKEIKVGDWTTSDVGLLTHNYWNLKRIEFYEDNNFTDSLKLVQTPERLTNKYYYYPNGNFEGINILGKIISNGQWSISGKVLTLGVSKYDIMELSATRFSIMIFLEILPNGKSKYAKETYVR